MRMKPIYDLIVVKPNATQEEVDSALDNDDGGQIFAQSVCCVFRIMNLFYYVFIVIVTYDYSVNII